MKNTPDYNEDEPRVLDYEDIQIIEQCLVQTLTAADSFLKSQLTDKVIEGVRSVPPSIRPTIDQENNSRSMSVFSQILTRNVYRNIEDNAFFKDKNFDDLCKKLEDCKNRLEQLRCYGDEGITVIDCFADDAYTPITRLKASLDTLGQNMAEEGEPATREDFEYASSYLLSLDEDTFNKTSDYIENSKTNNENPIRNMLNNIRNICHMKHHDVLEESCHIIDTNGRDVSEVKLLRHKETKNIVIYYIIEEQYEGLNAHLYPCDVDQSKSYKLHYDEVEDDEVKEGHKIRLTESGGEITDIRIEKSAADLLKSYSDKTPPERNKSPTSVALFPTKRSRDNDIDNDENNNPAKKPNLGS